MIIRMSTTRIVTRSKRCYKATPTAYYKRLLSFFLFKYHKVFNNEHGESVYNIKISSHEKEYEVEK